ncbi:MAG: hypothetical protein FJX36_07580 [Alphaproteobacteria bacterium]|nr:hypothetical protein [Alphaproteobacteria bacterium]
MAAMRSEQTAVTKARIERALDRMERATGRIQADRAARKVLRKDKRVEAVRGRLDAAIAELDRILKA